MATPLGRVALIDITLRRSNFNASESALGGPHVVEVVKKPATEVPGAKVISIRSGLPL